MTDPFTHAAFHRLEGRINWERRDRSSGWRVALDPIRALLRTLGHPEEGLKIVHVAGSKGKGSVSSLVTHALLGRGSRVGTYGSPHVDSITERIRIDGRNVGVDDLGAVLTTVLDAVEAGEARGAVEGEASWFDIMTAAALLTFRREGVEYAVLEVGLGGRLDSTNAIPSPEVAVVTTIALEHTEILGKTHAAIAGEKAGIVKPGCHLISGCDPASEAGAVLARVAREVGVAGFREAFDAGDQTFEEANVRVARAVMAALIERGHFDALSSGLELDDATITAARLPGRMERASIDGVPIVLDGAHVPESLALALREASTSHSGPVWVVIAVHREKDVVALAAPLVSLPPREILCASIPASGVHLSAEELLERLSRSYDALCARAVPDPADALLQACEAARKTDGGWVFVTGSLYLVGAVRGVILSEGS